MIMLPGFHPFPKSFSGEFMDVKRMRNEVFLRNGSRDGEIVKVLDGRVGFEEVD